METDKSLSITLEDLADGDAQIAVGRKRGISRQIQDGYWVSGESFVEVRIDCPQTEDAMNTAYLVAADLANTYVQDGLEEIKGNIDSLIQDAVDEYERQLSERNPR